MHLYDFSVKGLCHFLQQNWMKSSYPASGRFAPASRPSLCQIRCIRCSRYRMIKELWSFTGNRIAVRFAYEWRDASGNLIFPFDTFIE